MGDFFFLVGTVFHSRKVIADNTFKYSVFNVCFDVDKIDQLDSFFKTKFKGLLQVKLDRYLDRKNNIQTFLQDKFDYKAEKVFLQTMPSFLGYAFNPVSFWYCFKSDKLDAILCEVNNTFGERHYYWIHDSKHSVLMNWFQSKKEFHVSPFFQIDGYYQFRFQIDEQKYHTDIQYFNSSGQISLITWIDTKILEPNNFNIKMLLGKYGLLILMVTIRIHYQAMKLFWKKVKFYSKPERGTKEVTHESEIIFR